MTTPTTEAKKTNRYRFNKNQLGDFATFGPEHHKHRIIALAHTHQESVGVNDIHHGDDYQQHFPEAEDKRRHADGRI